MEALKQDTTSSFAKVRESLDAQTQLIHKSQAETQEQLRVFGKQIMDQLSSLESEKRRKSEERGGMFSPGTSARESSPSSSSSSSSSSSDVLIESEETGHLTSDARVAGGDDGLRDTGGILPGWQNEFLTQLRTVVQARRQDIARTDGPDRNAMHEILEPRSMSPVRPPQETGREMGAGDPRLGVPFGTCALELRWFRIWKRHSGADPSSSNFPLGFDVWCRGTPN